jgi:hypothetical protein
MAMIVYQVDIWIPLCIHMCICMYTLSLCVAQPKSGWEISKPPVSLPTTAASSKYDNTLHALSSRHIGRIVMGICIYFWNRGIVYMTSDSQSPARAAAVCPASSFIVQFTCLTRLNLTRLDSTRSRPDETRQHLDDRHLCTYTSDSPACGVVARPDENPLLSSSSPSSPSSLSSSPWSSSSSNEYHSCQTKRKLLLCRRWDDKVHEAVKP